MSPALCSRTREEPPKKKFFALCWPTKVSNQTAGLPKKKKTVPYTTLIHTYTNNHTHQPSLSLSLCLSVSLFPPFLSLSLSIYISNNLTQQRALDRSAHAVGHMQASNPKMLLHLIYMCICTNTHTHIHAYICICVCVCVCVCVFVYMCVYMCVYVYVYMRILIKVKYE